MAFSLFGVGMNLREAASLVLDQFLDEGKIRHLVVSERPFWQVGDGYTDRLNRRAGEIFDNRKKNPVGARDYMYGAGRSPNRHLNAVVRHILPSLGSMLAGTRGKGYSQINKEHSREGQEMATLSPRESEIFKEYDRHLTDLAHHIYKRQIHRKKNNREHIIGDPASNWFDDENPRDVLSVKRHDMMGHRGGDGDIHQLGEIIISFIEPEHSEDRNLHLHSQDHHLEDYSLPQLKARLDHFYRNKIYKGDKIIGNAPEVPAEHHDRILSASRKISIPAGRFKGKRQAKTKRFGPVGGMNYDDLSPTKKRKKHREYRLIGLKYAKNNPKNTP